MIHYGKKECDKNKDTGPFGGSLPNPLNWDEKQKTQFNCHSGVRISEFICFWVIHHGSNRSDSNYLHLYMQQLLNDDKHEYFREAKCFFRQS